MTDQEMNTLADLIVEKLSAKQEEYDKAFQADMQSMIAESQQEANISFGTISQLDLIKEQITKLSNDQATAVAMEDYDTASLIKTRIEDLKAKYKL
jgi:protein-arginine kinase activator protein McsA